MSGTSEQQVDELERAILARAKDLADELEKKASNQRDGMLRDSRERLRLTEEREVLQAKSDADRQVRRRIQASQLELDARLDRLRWELVTAVQSRLAERMSELHGDREAYRDWLTRMVGEAAAELPEGELLAEVCADDLAWLRDEWDDIAGRAAPGRRIVLCDDPTWGSGGVRLRNADNTAQVDNRFEGRLARLEAGIQRVILERLFAGDLHPATAQATP